jgi:hypothetical protein
VSQAYHDISELADRIASFKEGIAADGSGRFSGICGFDGFIDTFIKMESPKTMAEFGPGVTRAAGISASYFVKRQGDKFGGNGPLLASALHDIFDGEIDISYIGAMGRGQVLPIYQEALGQKMRHLYTLAEPAHSDCLEFLDGKIMLGDLRSCAEVTLEQLIECVGTDTLDAHLKDCRFVGAVNWGKLVNVGGIWRNIAKRLGELGVPKKHVFFFMDLAEFEQRPMADRLELLGLVGEITEQCHTLLSFNLKEAWQMAEVVGGDFLGRKAPEDVAALAEFLRRSINADRIIIHPNDGAACASGDGCVYIPGPFCREPLISTGAGDNFGAGCLAGALRGFDDLTLLLAGVCASGHFVRSGRSASFRDMSNLLDAWLGGTLAARL